MAAHKLHLSPRDRVLLKEMRITTWSCPECTQKALPLPKLRVEEAPKQGDETPD